jgi:hypothetical protein
MNRVIWGEIPPSAYVSLVQRYCRKRSWRERYVRQVPGGWGYLSRGMARMASPVSLITVCV